MAGFAVTTEASRPRLSCSQYALATHNHDATKEARAITRRPFCTTPIGVVLSILRRDRIWLETAKATWAGSQKNGARKTCGESAAETLGQKCWCANLFT